MVLQFDVTFPALACSIVSLDAMDISGEQHLDVVGIRYLFSVSESFVHLISHISRDNGRNHADQNAGHKNIVKN